MTTLIVLAIPVLLVLVPFVIVELRRNRGTFEAAGKRHAHADRLERSSAETRTYMDRHDGYGV